MVQPFQWVDKLWKERSLVAEELKVTSQELSHLTTYSNSDERVVAKWRSLQVLDLWHTVKSNIILFQRQFETKLGYQIVEEVHVSQIHFRN